MPSSGKPLKPIAEVSFDFLDSTVADHVRHARRSPLGPIRRIHVLDNLGEDSYELGVGVESLKKRSLPGRRAENTILSDVFIVNFRRERLVDVLVLQQEWEPESGRQKGIHLPYCVKNTPPRLVLDRSHAYMG